MRVTNLTTKVSALFPADRWIGLGPPASSSSDSITWVKLSKQPDVLQPQAAAAADASGRTITLQVAEMTTTGSSSSGSPKGSLHRTLGVTRPVVQPGYQVTFHTSNIWAAGTDAKVYFELTGRNGSSGKGHAEILSGGACLKHALKIRHCYGWGFLMAWCILPSAWHGNKQLLCIFSP